MTGYLAVSLPTGSRCTPVGWYPWTAMKSNRWRRSQSMKSSCSAIKPSLQRLHRWVVTHVVVQTVQPLKSWISWFFLLICSAWVSIIRAMDFVWEILSSRSSDWVCHIHDRIELVHDCNISTTFNNHNLYKLHTHILCPRAFTAKHFFSVSRFQWVGFSLSFAKANLGKQFRVLWIVSEYSVSVQAAHFYTEDLDTFKHEKNRKRLFWDTPTLHRTARTLDTPPRQNDFFHDDTVMFVEYVKPWQLTKKLKGVNTWLFT